MTAQQLPCLGAPDLSGKGDCSLGKLSLHVGASILNGCSLSTCTCSEGVGANGRRTDRLGVAPKVGSRGGGGGRCRVESPAFFCLPRRPHKPGERNRLYQPVKARGSYCSWCRTPRAAVV